MFYLGVNVNLLPLARVGVNSFHQSPEERDADAAQSGMAEGSDAARDTLANRGTSRSALQDLLDQPSFKSFDPATPVEPNEPVDPNG